MLATYKTAAFPQIEDKKLKLFYINSPNIIMGLIMQSTITVHTTKTVSMVYADIDLVSHN